MLYIVKSELKIDGRLIDVFIHSFVYDTEEKAKEFIDGRIKEMVKFDDYTKVNGTTIERVDFAGSKTTHKYIIESLIKDF